MDNRPVPARFYAPAAEKSGDVVELPEEEVQHLVRVLRLKAGAAVRVFNGRGGEFEAVVERAGKTRGAVRVGEPVPPAGREPGVAVTLVLGVLKGDNMDAAVRDATMMGVAAIQPLVAARSEVTLASLQRAKRVERWRRIAVSSAKQCGRATLPAVLEPTAFAGLRLWDGPNEGPLRLPEPALMFVEPSAPNGTVALSELGPAPREATLIMGPEGGWTADEIARAAACCRLVTLGRLTLRADAMPTVAMAALLTVWREL